MFNVSRLWRSVRVLGCAGALAAGIGLGLGGCQSGSTGRAVHAEPGVRSAGAFGEPEGQGVPIRVGGRWVQSGNAVDVSVAVEDKVYADSGNKCTYIVDCVGDNIGSYFSGTFPFEHEVTVDDNTPTTEFTVPLSTKAAGTKASFHILVRRKNGANNYKGASGMITVLP